MIDINQVDFNKQGGLVPACIQDETTLQVLMVGFMNQEALAKTLATGRVTFFSRTRKTLWTKGETSGNFLEVKDMSLDCDVDSILILAKPMGPTCHRGQDSCFSLAKMPFSYWLGKLSQIIQDRIANPKENSYTSKLMQSGIKRIAQKVGEEGVEVAIASLTESNQDLAGEAVDLLYHLLVLMQVKKLPLEEVANIIEKRYGEGKISK